ncbi:mitotic interactor and substrate of PLK1 isoform X2 [Equus asinus]|nr:mitotic interactor and substrate of PLK1 isoform X2 [Equus asinus]XP_044609542.1 mitotic interactor and substrate of PLK1 isoform X2 [Equus asinus]
MDRVTRYQILNIPHSRRLAGPAFDGDPSYTVELVSVGPQAGGWSQDDPQAWPADRKARPNLARPGAPYSPRAFSVQRSARSLHPEDGEEEEAEVYHLDVRRPWDLERERWVVIQGQAVKTSDGGATLGDAPDHGAPGSPGRRPPSTPAEENAVDREQIDFLAARRQFLGLEQARTDAPRRPAGRAAPAHDPPRLSPAPKAGTRPPLANGHAAPAKPPGKEVVLEERGVHGWSAGAAVPAAVEPPEAPGETPIEREIRLAQEREAALREQRGLQRAGGRQELVQVVSRPVLSKVTLADAPRRERGRPSLYVQRDLAQETQREQDHLREGRRVGRASTPDWASDGSPPPAGLRRALSSDSILGPTPDARAADPVPEARRVSRIPPSAYQPYLGSAAPRSELPAVYADDAEAAGSPRHLWGAPGKPRGAKQERSKAAQGAPRADGGVVRWESFRLRPLRFGVPEEPPQAEAPRGWGWEAPGAPATRLHRSGSSELLEREVETVLRRERELAAERRSALFPEVFSPSPDADADDDRGSRSSSQASGLTGSYSVSEVHFRPIHLQSGLAWTAEAPAEAAPGQRKRKEQWYAGINPADNINSDILEATRVTRHKSARAERWEAGIYASEDED